MTADAMVKFFWPYGSGALLKGNLNYELFLFRLIRRE